MAKITALVENAGQVLTCAADAPDLVGARNNTVVAIGGNAIAAIGTEIRSQYILSYNPDNKVEGGFHKIVVIVNRPELNVRTRPGYWMAGVPD